MHAGETQSHDPGIRAHLSRIYMLGMTLYIDTSEARIHILGFWAELPIADLFAGKEAPGDKFSREQADLDLKIVPGKICARGQIFSGTGLQVGRR